MSDTKFTPGPWEVVKHERFPFQREVKAESGYICDMEGLTEEDMLTVEANAHLIAAAPEMHETLSSIAAFAVGYGDVCEIIAKRARAALAKADGK